MLTSIVSSVVANPFGYFLGFIALGVIIFIAWRAEQRSKSEEWRLDSAVALESREARLDREVKLLREEVKKLKITVETLTQQLVEAFDKIRLLEGNREVSLASPAEKFPLPELLVIFGSNAAITARDKSGLGQEGIDFESVNIATRETIVGVLVERREDRRKLRWVHISSDADQRGIAMVKEDGSPDIVEPEWWRQNFDALEVLMIAACKGMRVATQMAGLATWLVYFRDGVNNNDAGAFSGAFWGEVVCGTPVDTAYAKARQRVPAVRDFVVLRHREA